MTTSRRLSSASSGTPKRPKSRYSVSSQGSSAASPMSPMRPVPSSSTRRRNSTSTRKKSRSSSDASASNNILVAVRVRPFTQKERKQNETSIIEMHNGTQTIIHNPAHPSSSGKTFTFDRSYSSFSPQSEEFVSQQQIFNDLGKQVLDNAWKGFNSSLLSYGQTGSGKTFTIFGSNQDPGLVPRLCRSLFDLIDNASKKDKDKSFRVEASMLEIYAERVRDLFDPTNPRNASGLKVRENSRTGPYVEGLCINYCANSRELENMLDEGTKFKTMAATNMNENSSRSHTIFQLYLTQNSKVGKKKTQKRSIISLIDLAGSERASKAQTSGQRLKEGSYINRSLSTLGNVINKLSENKGEFVPYRDSVLTYLLRESLGGNAKTVMLATISPAKSNEAETLSTLRYAQRAKKIVNKARVNEDSTSKIINDLKAQIEMLKEQLQSKSGSGVTPSTPATAEENDRLRLQLEQTQRLMQEMKMTDEEREELAEMQKQKRRAYLQKAGLFIADRREVPHIVNLNEDVSMNECLLYFFAKDKTTSIGSHAEKNDIILQGTHIQEQHCLVKNVDNSTIEITPFAGADVYVNGKKVTETTELNSSDRIIFGTQQLFRFSNPSKPSTDNKIVDVEMARAEIEEEIQREFEQKREEKQNELNQYYAEKKSEQEDKIRELESRRELLLAEIQKSQQQQLEAMNKAQNDTEEMERLEQDVRQFQEQLASEQQKQQQMEKEKEEKAEELSKMRRNLRLLAKSLQNEQNQRKSMQEQHSREKDRLQKEQQKIREEAKGMSAQLEHISAQNKLLAINVQKHKQAQDQSQQELHSHLKEQAELLPVLQNMMMEQEKTLRARIDDLSQQLTRKVCEMDDLRDKYEKIKRQKVNTQDEFIASILGENDKLKQQMRDMRSRSPAISAEELAQKVRGLQQEIQRYRAEKIEHERRQMNLEMRLNQKEAIIKALQGEYDT